MLTAALIAWLLAVGFALVLCRAAAIGDRQITSSHRRAQGPPARVPTQTSRRRQQ